MDGIHTLLKGMIEDLALMSQLCLSRDSRENQIHEYPYAQRNSRRLPAAPMLLMTP